MGRRRRPKGATEVSDLGRRQVFLSHLHRWQSGGQALRDDREQIAITRLRAVGDEAEPQLVDQSGRPSSGEDALA